MELILHETFVKAKIQDSHGELKSFFFVRETCIPKSDVVVCLLINKTERENKCFIQVN